MFIFFISSWLCLEQVIQEAQLLERDCTMLPVIRYFAKSLKVIRNDTLQQSVCKSLLVFHCNYVCTVFEIFCVHLKSGLELIQGN